MVFGARPAAAATRAGAVPDARVGWFGTIIGTTSSSALAQRMGDLALIPRGYGARPTPSGGALETLRSCRTDAIFSYLDKGPLQPVVPQAHGGQPDAPCIGNRKAGCFLHAPGHPIRSRNGPVVRVRSIRAKSLAGTRLATWNIVNYLQTPHRDGPAT